MRLPHKEPLLFAKKSLKSDKTAALVEIDFGYIPTLAMHIEAAAQAFSFVEIKSDCSWGVVAMIKDAILHAAPLDERCLCEITVLQAIDPYYKVRFKMITSKGDEMSSGELSIKIF